MADLLHAGLGILFFAACLGLQEAFDALTGNGR
jgi:hypothetical protein